MSPTDIMAEHMAAVEALEAIRAVDPRSLDTPEKRLQWELAHDAAWKRWNKTWFAKDEMLQGLGKVDAYELEEV